MSSKLLRYNFACMKKPADDPDLKFHTCSLYMAKLAPLSVPRAKNFIILVLGFMNMYLCNHAPSFFSLHEWKQRRRFLNMWYFLHIYLCHQGVVRSQLSQFRFFLLQRYFKPKVVIIGLVVFKKTLKFQIEHSQRTMIDEDQMQHAT